jgi:hypothetical protein
MRPRCGTKGGERRSRAILSGHSEARLAQLAAGVLANAEMTCTAVRARRARTVKTIAEASTVAGRRFEFGVLGRSDRPQQREVPAQQNQTDASASSTASTAAASLTARFFWDFALAHDLPFAAFFAEPAFPFFLAISVSLPMMIPHGWRLAKSGAWAHLTEQNLG